MITLTPVGDLFTRALKLYQQHWKVFLKIICWSLVPVLAITVLVGFETAYSLSVGYRQTETLLIGILILISMTAALWVQVRLIQTSLDVVDGKSETASAPQAWSRVLPLLFWNLIWMIPIMFGFIFFVIPGIYLAVLWSFSAFRLIENKKPYARGSAKLISPVWWPVFGRHLIMILIAFGLSSVGQMITAIIATIFALFGLGAHQLIAPSIPLTEGGAGMIMILFTQGLSLLIQVIIQLGLAPFKLIYEALVYRSVEQAVTTPTTDQPAA